MAMRAKKIQAEESPPGPLPAKPVLAEAMHLMYNPGLRRDFTPLEQIEALTRMVCDGAAAKAAPFVEDKPVPLKLVASNKVVFDDYPDDLTRWMASYTTISFNKQKLKGSREKPAMCLLQDRAKHEERAAQSQKCRNGFRNPSGTSSLLLAFSSESPVEGWWGQRPPTVMQLINNAEKIAHRLDQQPKPVAKKKSGFSAFLRRAEEIEAAAKSKTSKPMMLAPAQQPKFQPLNQSVDTGLTPAQRTVFENSFWLHHDLEVKRFQSWLLSHDEKYTGKVEGLRLFFRTTGVPENDLGPYKIYWTNQKILANSYTPKELYWMDKEQSEYALWWKDALACPDETARLDKWLEDHWLTGNTFLPSESNKSTVFKRKMAAYLMAIDRFEEGKTTAHHVDMLRNQLFKSHETEKAHLPYTCTKARRNSFACKMRPMVPVGKPYGEFDIEHKKVLVREANRLSAQARKNPNQGKSWPYLDTLKTVTPEVHANATKDLARRLSERIFSEEEIRSLIVEEMQNFTTHVVAEASVAFEDYFEGCADKLMSKVTSHLSLLENNRQFKNLGPCPSHNPNDGPPPKGYIIHPTGVILPDWTFMAS